MVFRSYPSTWCPPFGFSYQLLRTPPQKVPPPSPLHLPKPRRVTNSTGPSQPLHLGHRPSSLSNPPAFAMLSLNLKQNAVLSLKNLRASQTGAEHVEVNSRKAIDSNLSHRLCSFAVSSNRLFRSETRQIRNSEKSARILLQSQRPGPHRISMHHGTRLGFPSRRATQKRSHRHRCRDPKVAIASLWSY